jgi:hypothetical protein
VNEAFLGGKFILSSSGGNLDGSKLWQVLCQCRDATLLSFRGSRVSEKHLVHESWSCACNAGWPGVDP